MAALTSMLRRFEAKQMRILLQYKVSAAFQVKEKKTFDLKFFCEDIEPVSLIWAKVDEAMLTSSSDIDSHSFEDSEDDLDEMSTVEVMSHCNPSTSSPSLITPQKSGSFSQRKDELELVQPLVKLNEDDTFC